MMTVEIDAMTDERLKQIKAGWTDAYVTSDGDRPQRCYKMAVRLVPELLSEIDRLKAEVRQLQCDTGSPCKGCPDCIGIGWIGARKSEVGLKALDDWQPIETAPRDGSIFNARCSFGWTLGKWQYGEWHALAVSTDKYGDNAVYKFLSTMLTHWMPLPELSRGERG